jgi:ankyrin repeat protein
LIAAAEANNPFGVRALLKAGLSPEVKLPRSNYSLVQWAAKNGHLDVLELAVNRGADVFWNDPNGTTALTLAMRNRHTAVAEYLQVRPTFSLHGLRPSPIDFFGYFFFRRSVGQGMQYEVSRARRQDGT